MLLLVSTAVALLSCTAAEIKWSESISLDHNQYTFHVIGNVLTLNATVLPTDATDKSVEWSSSNEDVASVDSDGRVTAKGNGRATITVATKDKGKMATCAITVSQWVTGIALNKTEITIYEGMSRELVATVTPDNAADKSLTWMSSDESVATVNAKGEVKAVSKGNASITVKTADGSDVQNTCSVTVLQAVSMALNWSSVSMLEGEEEDLELTVTPQDTQIEWSSSNPEVVTVENGHIKAVSPGASTITVSAKDEPSFKASCQVSVSNQSAVSNNQTVYLGETLDVAAVYSATEGYTWKSLNPSVVTISQNGVVTPHKLGDAIVIGRKVDASAAIFMGIQVWKKQDGGGGDNEGIGEGDEI